ncbi:MAG: class I SAM-dependent methyltransferase [Bacteroidales bacterium]|nr:class I SAM-dependent methyltransferase [Bacteroidales bacterium]
MNSRIQYTLKYIKYWLFAKHKKGHGVHSPFIYNLIINVLNNKKSDEALNAVFDVYKKYLKSKEVLKFDEIGAGTNYKKSKKITIGEIIKRSSINRKYGELIYNLTKYFNPTEILELGTSVGISTAFIAQAAPKSNFNSIEGIEEKIKIAKKIASELKQHTEFIHGDFDEILESVLEKYDKLDLVFFDGNHKNTSTLNYFNSCLEKIQNESIFIFDDIHWSSNMEEAWEEIKNHPKVKVSVDLFRMGLIFFRKELSYEHYVIKF